MKQNQLCTQSNEIRDTLKAEVAELFVWVFYSCCLCQTGNMRGANTVEFKIHYDFLYYYGK